MLDSQLTVFFFRLLFIFLSFSDAHAVSEIKNPTKKYIYIGLPHQTNNSEKLYPVKLLKRAIAVTDPSSVLKFSLAEMSRDRTLRQVSLGENVDVFWAMTNVEREKKLTPIRIPIDKGLYGWRVLLIHKDDKSLDNIRHLSDLKKKVFLQGYDWPDTQILIANKLNVVTSDKHQLLFSMMEKKRADIFPRSVLEVHQEKLATNHQLKIHPSVSIYYPTALYYFVSKENKKLAHQIELGLNILIRTGEFEKLFQDEFGDDITAAIDANRRVITLKNPYLPVETPFNRPELWYFKH